MWRRVGAAISCAAWLLLACGKSEHGTPRADDSAGGAAQAGSATTGGDVASVGGRAEAGTAAGGEASAAGDASVGGAGSCSGNYRACGCGCCEGQTVPQACVYPERGETLAAIVAADVARKHDLQECAVAGCGFGFDYVCCESPAPSAEQATYSSSVVIGDTSRININKMAADCTTLTLRERGPSPPAKTNFPLDEPAWWDFQEGTRLACASSVVRPRAIGALGTVSLRVLDDACVADVHVVLFFSDDAHTVDAERLDVDALPIELNVASCH